MPSGRRSPHYRRLQVARVVVRAGRRTTPSKRPTNPARFGLATFPQASPTRSCSHTWTSQARPSSSLSASSRAQAPPPRSTPTLWMLPTPSPCSTVRFLAARPLSSMLGRKRRRPEAEKVQQRLHQKEEKVGGEQEQCRSVAIVRT